MRNNVQRLGEHGTEASSRLPRVVEPLVITHLAAHDGLIHRASSGGVKVLCRRQHSATW
jgi:hypothetical protein